VYAWRERLKGHGTLFRYSGASILLQGATMVCNLLVLRWMKPESIGLFQSVLLIQTYSFLIQAGTLNGLNRELPFALGAGKNEETLKLAGTAQTIAIAGAVVLLLGIPVCLLLVKDMTVLLCVIAMLVGSSSSIYRNYLAVTYRAERAFHVLANLTLVETVLVVISVPTVYWFELEGLAGRFVFLSCAGTALNYLFRPLPKPGRFSWKSLKTLLLTGAPLFAFGYLLSIARTFPRVILLSESGVLMVGMFAPAAAVIGALQVIPVSIAQYVYPQMSYRLGKTGNPSDLWQMAKVITIVCLIVSVPIAAILVMLIPILVIHFFPAYAEAAGAVRWAVVAGVFMGASIAVNALNSLKAWGWMAIYTVAFLVINFVLPFGAFRLYGTLESLAAGIAVAQGIVFLIGMYAIRRATSG
jgi:O-antigen/teichoic acid export membrane protein